jgi:hypothetical protein
MSRSTVFCVVHQWFKPVQAMIISRCDNDYQPPALAKLFCAQ